MTIIGKTLGNIGMGLGLRPHIGYWDGNWEKNLDIGCWDWYWGKLYWASTGQDPEPPAFDHLDVCQFYDETICDETSLHEP